MKWLGQYIQSLTARFRSDVYLEDIDTGTIASGGNLGLDSNNKIVKATDSAPVANTSTKGIVELATTAETTTGTDAARAVTPDGLKDGYQGSANVTTVGIIGTGSWRGTAINRNYIEADQRGITAVGTIETGVWEGTVVASAYLDSDTAHLTTDQTFTGVKTFNEAINKKSLNFIFVSNKFANSTASETYFSISDTDRDQPKGSEDGVGIVAVMPCNGILRQVEMVSSSTLSARSWTYRLYRIPSGTGYTSEILVATVAASAGAAASTNATISLVTDPGDGTNDITYETGYSATTMFTKGDRALFSLQSNSDAAGAPKINTTFCFELDETTL